ARLHWLMPRRLHDERFVDDDGGVLEAGVEIAVRPFFGGLAHRQRALGRGGEVLLGPFERLDFRTRRRSGGTRCRGRRRKPDVAIGAAVGAGGSKALDWIDDEGQRLET